MRHDQDDYAECDREICPVCHERIIPMNLPGSGWVSCACDVPTTAITQEDYYARQGRLQPVQRAGTVDRGR